MIKLEFWLKENNKKIEELTRDDWVYICHKCELSEDFIKENAKKVGWYYISIFQKLRRFY
jgi:hypothetical protein